MDILHSPLETLVLSYTSFDFLARACSFWTWVAVLTAAISLWRIKAASTIESRRKDYELLNPIYDNHPACTTQPHDEFHLKTQNPSSLTVLEGTERTEENFPSRECSSSSSGASDLYDGRCKGKLTVRFEFDGDEGLELPIMETWVDGKIDELKPVYSVREVYRQRGTMAVRPVLEWSWYCHVDLTVLNGSVVRLWNDDDDRRESHEKNIFRLVE